MRLMKQTRFTERIQQMLVKGNCERLQGRRGQLFGAKLNKKRCPFLDCLFAHAFFRAER
jgi:hypothetical protein